MKPPNSASNTLQHLLFIGLNHGGSHTLEIGSTSVKKSIEKKSIFNIPQPLSNQLTLKMLLDINISINSYQKEIWKKSSRTINEYATLIKKIKIDLHYYSNNKHTIRQQHKTNYKINPAT